MSEAQSQAERAFDQVVEWLEHFRPIEDPRQSGKVWYPLEEMLLLCLLAVLAGGARICGPPGPVIPAEVAEVIAVTPIGLRSPGSQGSNNEASRVWRCGCTTAITWPLWLSRAARKTAAISTG